MPVPVTTSDTLGLVLPDQRLETAVRLGLERVEEQLRRSATSDYPMLTQTSRHLVDAGGKRFRPLLTLLAAEFGDPAAPGIVEAATVCELTHLATLYHDDVMDEAARRRGVPSANARWDNTVAILTGDFLFARASDLLADLGPEAVRVQARTFERLVVGQIRETVGPEADADPVEHYLAVVADKTGSLIATAAHLGAMVAGAPGPTVAALTAFGERIGTAFQLADDVLDVVSESVQSGKTPGTDLREGVATLPVLHLRRMAGPADAELVALVAGAVSEADLARTLAGLRAHPAVESARAEVRRYADEARELLDDLPAGGARTALEALCDAVVDRTG